MAATGRDRRTRCNGLHLARALRVGMVIALVAVVCGLGVPLAGSGASWIAAAVAEDSHSPVSPAVAADDSLSAPTVPPADSRTLTVTIIADGQERWLSTEPVTVAELLSRAGVAVNGLDRVEPGLKTQVRPGMVVRVARVTRQRVRREIEIAVETTVHLDQRVHPPVVLHEGAPGRAVEVVEVWSRDGAETRRVLVSRQVMRRMQPRVVVRASAPLPSRGGDMLYMVATGYDPGPRSCGRWSSGHTAIGLHAGRGVVAVDPRVIPLGTRLYVEGYGDCIAGDVGSAIKGRRIDLGFDGYREALRWGRRTVRVTILE